MGNAAGPTTPDGRPARQFGEQIIEPGEPFSGDTLDVIRSLVEDDSAEAAQPAPAEITPEQSDEPLAKPEIANKVNGSEEVDAGDIAAASLAKEATVPPGESLLLENALNVPDPIVSDPVPVNHNTPETELASDPVLEEMTPSNEEVAQMISDLDRYVEEIAVIEPSGQIPLTEPDTRGSEVQEQPELRQRGEWRKLNVVEGGPGRFLRHQFSKPRSLALLVLMAVFLWRPWFIPTLGVVLGLFLLLLVIALGPDRVSAVAGWWFQRYRQRNPKGAARLILRGNRLLRRAEGLAERLPPAWVQGFYLPELEANGPAPEDTTFLQERFERIASQEQA